MQPPSSATIYYWSPMHHPANSDVKQSPKNATASIPNVFRPIFRCIFFTVVPPLNQKRGYIAIQTVCRFAYSPFWSQVSQQSFPNSPLSALSWDLFRRSHPAACTTLLPAASHFERRCHLTSTWPSLCFHSQFSPHSGLRTWFVDIVCNFDLCEHSSRHIR